MGEVRRRSDGTQILIHSHKAEGMWLRLKGLLGRQSLPKEEGLWIVPCNSIHMFFMKFAIDAVFLDRDRRVVRLYHSIRPWRCTPIVCGAHSCLEMAAGRASEVGLQVGDELIFVDSPTS
jgi:uncharacterized membrane protein (UPF0127 family)